MRFIYRNNEVGFKKWASSYISKAEVIVDIFPMYKHLSERFYREKQEEYKEALKVLDEYMSFLLLLSLEEREIFNRSIVRNEIIDDINKTKVRLIKESLFKKWQMVCFKNKQNRIKVINDKALGAELRSLRVQNFLSVTAVADALNIDPSTLRNYELGHRTISLNVLYGLSQIYDVSIEKLIG
ncbi:MAG: helix-turn-helix transcriptional regulator [Bacilli bacterium]